MAPLCAKLGFSVSVVGQLTAPASARSADSKNSTQRHKIALSIVGHSRISASPEDSLRDLRESDKQNSGNGARRECDKLEKPLGPPPDFTYRVDEWCGWLSEAGR